MGRGRQRSKRGRDGQRRRFAANSTILELEIERLGGRGDEGGEGSRGEPEDGYDPLKPVVVHGAPPLVVAGLVPFTTCVRQRWS